MVTDADADDYPFRYLLTTNYLKCHLIPLFFIWFIIVVCPWTTSYLFRTLLPSIGISTKVSLLLPFSLHSRNHPSSFSNASVGTPLSLTEGMAAGPFGDPNRYQNNAYGSMTIWDTLEGAFPRPISLFRTSTSIVSQSRSHVPNDLARVWVSAYAPDMSSYTPMYVQTTDISTHWTTGSMHAYDSEVAWWNFAVVRIFRFCYIF